jgi:hypothetical protein
MKVCKVEHKYLFSPSRSLSFVCNENIYRNSFCMHNDIKEKKNRKQYVCDTHKVEFIFKYYLRFNLSSFSHRITRMHEKPRSYLLLIISRKKKRIKIYLFNYLRSKHRR